MPSGIAQGEVPKLELRDLFISYTDRGGQKVQAVDNISLSVANKPGVGELAVFLGPSGCGKSTILKAVAGLLEPDAGKILIDGEEVAGTGRDRGMVFQSYTSFGWRTVAQNVEYGLELRGASVPATYEALRSEVGRRLLISLKPQGEVEGVIRSADASGVMIEAGGKPAQAVPYASIKSASLDLSAKERRRQALEIVEQVGLKDFANSYPKQLSGGMKQRVAIARTLINRPKLVLMDEPFGALDPQTRWGMQGLILDVLRKLDNTVLFVTHDVSEAVFLADVVFVLSHRPAKVLHRVEIPYFESRDPALRQSAEFKKVENHLLDLLQSLQVKGNMRMSL